MKYLDDKRNDLVCLEEIIPNLKYKIYYLTKNNFTGKQIYNDYYKCLLRFGTAKKLLAVQKSLIKVGLGLVVFDAYRPLSIQNIMWAAVPDLKYTAPPSMPSNHNRAAAIDLSLIDSHNKIIDMGTQFDEFGEKSHSGYKLLPEFVLYNRNVIKTFMENNGFIQEPTEWWHFNDVDANNYEVLDIPFEEF